MPLPESLAPLRHANFRWYWIAATVNLTGSTMAGVALAFAVLSITDSAGALGLVLAPRPCRPCCSCSSAG